jgi:hypothetical protein
LKGQLISARASGLSGGHVSTPHHPLQTARP